MPGDDDPLGPPPAPAPKDKLLGVAVAATSYVPAASVAVGTLVALLGTPFERRRDDWLRRLGEAVGDLQARDIDIAQLAERPEWVTAVHDASRIAMGEHLESKLEMLKAVLVNAAIHNPDPLTDLWTLRYLRWIDELDPVHIEFLRFGEDPRGWLEEHEKPTANNYMSGPRRTVFDLAEWPYSSEVIDLALEDLARLQMGGPGTGVVSAQAMWDPWTSPRGRRFLEWIRIV